MFGLYNVDFFACLFNFAFLGMILCAFDNCLKYVSWSFLLSFEYFGLY